MKHARLTFLVFTVAFLATLLVPSSVLAAVEIRESNAAEYPVVRATVVTPQGAEGPPALKANGTPVAGFQARNLAESKSVILAIDTSHSMRGESLIDAASAARSFLGAKPENDRIAITSFGNEARLLTEFSSSTIDADTVLRQLAVDETQGTALYDAIAISAEALAGDSNPARVIIVLTDGRDVSSSTSLDEAIASAREAGVAVYPIGIEGPQFSPEALREIAVATGGTYYGTASSEALTEVYSSIAEELRRTWIVEFTTSARPGEQIELVASSSGTTSSTTLRMPGSAPAPKKNQEPSQLVPSVLLESSWGPTALALVIGAIVLVAVALMIKATQGSWVRGRIDPHFERKSTDLAHRREGGRFALAGAIFRATEKTLGEKRFWLKLQRKLERADIPLRTAEFAYLMAGGALVLGIFAAVAGMRTIVILGLMAAGAFAPYFAISFKARKRVRAFEDQLPDILVTMAASLKAGHSFRQGMQSIVDEGAEPAASEFRKVLTETQLGRSMEAALAEMAERVGSRDFDFVITAVNIQRTVGGSLAGLFDMVAETVRNRQQFRRKIRGLTAMGRMSAYVLIGLPFFIGAAITAINTEYMAPLFTTSTGRNLILLGAGMMVVGSLILRKIVSFKG